MKQDRFWPLVVAAVAAVGSFLLSRVIWPDVPGMPAPEGMQMPLFIGVGIIESLAFGIGVAFLIFGWKYVSGRSLSDKLVWLSATWALVSWWPHDNMHRINDMHDYWGLLKLEYGFHATLLVGGVIIASFLWKHFSSRAA